LVFSNRNVTGGFVSELIKINNPLWVQNLAPLVESLLQRIKLPNINTYSLVTYLQQCAMANAVAELYVGLDENDIVAFANWSLRGTPFVGTAFLEFIYSRRYGTAEKLLLKFEEFAMKNNAPYLMADIVTLGKVSKHFKSIVQKHGYEYIESPYQSYIFRK